MNDYKLINDVLTMYGGLSRPTEFRYNIKDDGYFKVTNTDKELFGTLGYIADSEYTNMCKVLVDNDGKWHFISESDTVTSISEHEMIMETI